LCGTGIERFEMNGVVSAAAEQGEFGSKLAMQRIVEAH
jgi:hypothetical protein